MLDATRKAQMHVLVIPPVTGVVLEVDRGRDA
jgi:hypothetical protein